MAYTPKTWQCGEPIMADDLNHMEQGIAQGGSVAPLIVHAQVMTAAEIAEAGLTGTENSDVYRLDVTATEIKAAFDSGRQVHLIQLPNLDISQISSLVSVAEIAEDATEFGFAKMKFDYKYFVVDVWEKQGEYAYPVQIVRQHGVA